MRKHIHIVGCSPRSGTTLMQELMVTCFSINHQCAHERSLFDQDITLEGITCTKHPREAMYAGLALRANPDLHIIYLVRDPRDVVVSYHAKQPDKYFASASFYLHAEKYVTAYACHPRFIACHSPQLPHD